MTRNVAVFTGGRADYGLLRPLLTKLSDEPCFSVGVIAGGSHFSEKFGYTFRDIESDGFPVWLRIDALSDNDSDDAACQCMSKTIMLASKYFSCGVPDLLIVLGDRYEMFAAAQAAFMHKVPIVHLHGGEITEGAQDDAIRHAVTKLANWHFVATEDYRSRVIQLGEQPETVFVSGALGLDNILSGERLPVEIVLEELGLEPELPLYLVTMHPETMTHDGSDASTIALINALRKSLFEDDKERVNLVITFPNQDQSHKKIIEHFSAFTSEFSDRVVFVKSLGMQRYLSAMSVARAVIGNSSSGIIEAPSLGVPSVDIGTRQSGRLRAASVLHALAKEDDIIAKIKEASSAEFKAKASSVQNPYGDGLASDRIIGILKCIAKHPSRTKKFHDN